MPQLDLPLEHPIDVVATLRPLVRGLGDRTIRLRPGQAWWTVRAATGPATVVLRLLPDRLLAEAFGPGAHDALERVPELIGAGPGAPTPRDLPDGHRLVAALARAHPGVRIARSRAVMDALVPAILEQKITGDEARRACMAWYARSARMRRAKPAPGCGSPPTRSAWPPSPITPSTRSASSAGEPT